MMDMIGGLDILALLWFIILWLGYGLIVSFQTETYHLVKVMHRYRLQWIKHMIKRTERQLDLEVVVQLLRTVSLMALVSALWVIGAVMILAYSPNLAVLFSALPWSIPANPETWMLRTTVLVVVCLFAFFKCTWVMRQLGYVTVLIVAAPVYREGVDVIYDLKRQTKYVTKTATVLSNIDQHFISAVRGMYFAAALLSWYLHPLLFMLVTVFVVGVCYRREFMSRTLILLS